MKKLKEDRSIPFAHTDNFIETKKKRKFRCEWFSRVGETAILG